MSQSLAVSVVDVQRAKAKLALMRRSLGKWLGYRAKIDQVASGRLATGKPGAALIAHAQVSERIHSEQRLANKLSALLATIEPDASLPDPDLSKNPNAAVELAQFAMFGPQGGMSGFPVATTWMWPALIVGGLLIAVTVGINAAADVATEKERLACIQAGACTDYGFWLKGAAIVGLAWFVWKELGVGNVVRSKIKRRS